MSFLPSVIPDSALAPSLPMAGLPRVCPRLSGFPVTRGCPLGVGTVPLVGSVQTFVLLPFSERCLSAADWVWGQRPGGQSSGGGSSSQIAASDHPLLHPP